MTRYLRDPDGEVHAFEDSVPPEQINQEMMSRWKTKKEAPAPAPIPGSTPGGMQPVEGAPDLRMVPLSPEAEQFKRMGVVGGYLNNRALATAGTNLYEHDPTQISRATAAKGTGPAAELAKRQAGGQRIIPGIEALRRMIEETDEPTWSLAAGPYNAQVMRPEVEFPMHPTAWKAPEMTPVQARRIWGVPLVGNDPNSEANQKAWKKHNDLDHLVNALAEQYIGAVPGGAGAVNSDAKLKVFVDTIKRIMFANDTQGAHDVLDTAEDASRNVFALGPRLGSYANPVPASDPASVAHLRKGTWIKTPDGRVLRKDK